MANTMVRSHAGYRDTMTRSRVQYRETDWQMLCRLMKRCVRRFIRRHAAALILIGLPLIGMFIGIFIGVKATTHAQSTKINDYGRQRTYTAYTVESGDTVWGIAQDLAALNPEYNDIRQYVAAIESLNQMPGDRIKEGQTILIPYYINQDGTISHDEIYSKYGIGQ